MDSDGSGAIGYDEFTLLSEERWRNIDPYKQYQEGVSAAKAWAESESERVDSLNATQSDYMQMGLAVNDVAGMQKLERMAKNKVKVPLKRDEKDTGFANINRLDETNTYLTQSMNIQAHGRPTDPHQNFQTVMRHEYLRKSMVERIERKSLIKLNKLSLQKHKKERQSKPTVTTQLRSKSLLDKFMADSLHVRNKSTEQFSTLHPAQPMRIQDNLHNTVDETGPQAD